jgi:hypothetical protein
MLKKKSIEERLRTTETDLIESSRGLLATDATGSSATGAEEAMSKYQNYYQAYTQKWYIAILHDVIWET